MQQTVFVQNPGSIASAHTGADHIAHGGDQIHLRNTLIVERIGAAFYAKMERHLLRLICVNRLFAAYTLILSSDGKLFFRQIEGCHAVFVGQRLFAVCADRGICNRSFPFIIHLRHELIQDLRTFAPLKPGIVAAAGIKIRQLYGNICQFHREGQKIHLQELKLCF